MTTFTPNSPHPDARGGHERDNPGSGTWATFAARSRHEGGVFACFADGSVRFVSEDVDLAVWHALGTRAGAELIADSDY